MALGWVLRRRTPDWPDSDPGQAGKPHVSRWLALICGFLFLAGIAIVVLYASATTGAHLRYVGVGVLAAFAAFVTGCLFGFLFGIPKAVSSGAYRHVGGAAGEAGSTGVGAVGTAGGAAPAQATPPSPGASQPAGPATAALVFEPSSNLAEVSDWLTKLLLGAGLVSLTKLGRPLGALFNAVARGLESPSVTTTTGPARVVAGAIILLYTILGFLGGYVVTTLWFGRRMSKSMG